MSSKIFPNTKDNERGGSLIEFTVVAAVFFMMIVGSSPREIFITRTTLLLRRRGAELGMQSCTQ